MANRSVQYRMEYILKNGTRGVWEFEGTYETREDAKKALPDLFVHVSNYMKRHYKDKVLERLIVVEVTDQDVEAYVG